MIRLTRRYRFSASHRLHTAALTEDANVELYGKCNNPYGHGHNYVLDVTVEGPIDESSGRVCDVAALDRLVTRYILKDFDHGNMNEDLADFESLVPTSENVTLAIEARLRGAWKSEFPGQWPRLSRLRLEETKRNSFEHTT